mmetsp:Transcript_69999/g.158261  ORF Transcript_69999/g.158261 Transcript_69999/m.158261 type:complete len:234 (+) Transcript_69999:325-1026(+)
MPTSAAARKAGASPGLSGSGGNKKFAAPSRKTAPPPDSPAVLFGPIVFSTTAAPAAPAAAAAAVPASSSAWVQARRRARASLTICARAHHPWLIATRQPIKSRGASNESSTLGGSASEGRLPILLLLLGQLQTAGNGAAGVGVVVGAALVAAAKSAGSPRATDDGTPARLNEGSLEPRTSLATWASTCWARRQNPATDTPASESRPFTISVWGPARHTGANPRRPSTGSSTPT